MALAASAKNGYGAKYAVPREPPPGSTRSASRWSARDFGVRAT